MVLRVLCAPTLFARFLSMDLWSSLGDNTRRHSFEIVEQCGRPIDCSDCVVEFSTKFDRIPHPQMEMDCESRWRDALASGRRLFDASKFRLGYCTRKGDRLHFGIGLTSYKDLVLTNMCEDRIFIDSLHRYGEEKFQNPQASFADPIGVGCAIIVQSRWLLLIRRSDKVMEAAGMIDVPGGHSEPEIMQALYGYSVDQRDQWRPEFVIEEIFDSAEREICDEVNLPPSSFKEPRLMGVLRNSLLAGKPHFAFVTTCELDPSVIRSMYTVGGPDAFESSDIVLMDLKDLVSGEKKETVELIDAMSSTCKGTLHLLRTILLTGVLNIS